MENKLYGIKVTYKNGDTFYFGKGHESLTKQSVFSSKASEVDGKECFCTKLNKSLIEKYGFTHKSVCQRAASKLDALIGLDKNFEKAGIVEVVELNDSLFNKVDKEDAFKCFQRALAH